MERALRRIIQAHDELEAAKEELAAAEAEAGALGPVRGLDDTDDFAAAIHAGLDPNGPPSPAITPIEPHRRV
jgi:NAD(P)H-dependent flavin oxidoreductase YrpB (nitropropane dioxygenase family)